jgi:ribosome maturation factor RimP
VTRASTWTPWPTCPGRSRLVTVRAREAQVTARIVAVDDEVVALDLDGQLVEYSFGELGQGRVQVEFSRLDEIDEDELDEYGEDEDDDEDDGEFPDEGQFSSDADPDDPDARREDGEQ